MGRLHGIALSALLGLTSFSAGSKKPGQLVADRASDLVGIREQGCNNCGPEVECMLAMVGQPRGRNWCGAASYAAHRAAGIRLPGDSTRYAWVPSWFPRSRIVWKPGHLVENVQPGDQIGLHFPKLGRVAHIGTVIAVEGRWVRTAEGNSGAISQRDGGGMVYQRRRLDSIWAISRWH